MKVLTAAEVADVKRDAIAVTWRHEPSDVVRKPGSNVTLQGVHALCDSLAALLEERQDLIAFCASRAASREHDANILSATDRAIVNQYRGEVRGLRDVLARMVRS